MKQFQVPAGYRSTLISNLKASRKKADRMKKDFSATLLNYGAVKIYLARHFGFCYGVENAIEIAYKCLEENPGKNIYLLSEMIHNPHVNKDLQEKGLQFLQDTYGKQIIPFEDLKASDIVIIPAFGTTLAIEEKLNNLGVAVQQYNTTCPFVEKVWNRGESLAEKGYSLVIHGKPTHEETRATFSRSAANTPAVIVNNMQDAIELAGYITGQLPEQDFYTNFDGRYSVGFNISTDLNKFGVINQTTQLASDTQAIADYLKKRVQEHYQLTDETISTHFAETRDTLCYATNDNQTAVAAMLQTPANLAIVVGGYNSSNTSHLVELCEAKLPTYYIHGANCLLSKTNISHYNWREKIELNTQNYLPETNPSILITSGASCPDATVEQVIDCLLEFYPNAAKEPEISWLGTD